MAQPHSSRKVLNRLYYSRRYRLGLGLDMGILTALKDQSEIQDVYPRYCDVIDAKQSDRLVLDAVNVDGLAGAAAMIRPGGAGLTDRGVRHVEVTVARDEARA